MRGTTALGRVKPLLRRLVAAGGVLATIATAVVFAGEPAMARSRPSGYTIDGIDTAKYQHPNGAAINWGQVRSSGVEIATMKATRGTDVTDPWFTKDFTAARAAGLAVAPYHFYAASSPNTGSAQADHFIAALRSVGYTGQRAGELPPVFDFEWDEANGGCWPYVTVADAKAWLDKVQKAFGRKPIIYTTKSFISSCLGGSTAFGGYPLQVAEWSEVNSPKLPAGWNTWLLWQYSCSARVPGVADTDVCVDVFNGTQATLNAMANFDAAEPEDATGEAPDFDGDGRPD
ncbi:glycoside hydrolase family 25 protein, partial [Sphaerisporangium melleum]